MHNDIHIHYVTVALKQVKLIEIKLAIGEILTLFFIFSSILST